MADEEGLRTHPCLEGEPCQVECPSDQEMNQILEAVHRATLFLRSDIFTQGGTRALAVHEAGGDLRLYGLYDMMCKGESLQRISRGYWGPVSASDSR